MAKNLFSVPIFFIIFRETIEAAIIVSCVSRSTAAPHSADVIHHTTISILCICRVLLSFVEQLMSSGKLAAKNINSQISSDGGESLDVARSKRIIRRMRIQVSSRGMLFRYDDSVCGLMTADSVVVRE